MTNPVYKWEPYELPVTEDDPWAREHELLTDDVGDIVRMAHERVVWAHHVDRAPETPLYQDLAERIVRARRNISGRKFPEWSLEPVPAAWVPPVAPRLRAVTKVCAMPSPRTTHLTERVKIEKASMRRILRATMETWERYGAYLCTDPDVGRAPSCRVPWSVSDAERRTIDGLRKVLA